MDPHKPHLLRRIFKMLKVIVEYKMSEDHLQFVCNEESTGALLLLAESTYDRCILTKHACHDRTRDVDRS